MRNPAVLSPKMEFFMPSGILQRAGFESGSRQAAVFGVGISFIVFISIVMAIRMWVRVKVIRAVGSDDSMFLVRFQALSKHEG
jgi:hypothetical protein